MPTTVSAFSSPTETFRLTEGALPDRNGGIVAGRGVITPSLDHVTRNGKTVPLVPWEFTVLPDASMQYVDGDGVVYSSIPLPGTDIPGVTAGTNLQYRAQRWYSQDGVPVLLDDFVFNAPSGGSGSLSSLAPVDVVEGVQITRGETGPVGPAPVLVAGTATVVAAGASPDLDVRVVAPGTYALDVTVPAAPAGPAGAPGQIGPAGMTWCGPWDAERDYVDTDVVSYDKSSWFAADNPPVGEVPSDASAFWNVLSVHGAQGDPGLPGAAGANAPIPVFSSSITALPAGSVMTSEVSGVYPDLSIDLGVPEPAEGTGGTGSGGSAVQDTGPWLHYEPSKGSKTIIQRVANIVTVDFKMRMQASYADWQALNISGGQGFSSNAFLGLPFAGGYGKVSGDVEWYASGGSMTLYVHNGQYDGTDPFNIYGDIYVSFSYPTWDAFPTDPAAVLPGFSLATSSALWSRTY